eukprot:671184-Alexandrium_andersonii.AAC.1
MRESELLAHPIDCDSLGENSKRDAETLFYVRAQTTSGIAADIVREHDPTGNGLDVWGNMCKMYGDARLSPRSG